MVSGLCTLKLISSISGKINSMHFSLSILLPWPNAYETKQLAGRTLYAIFTEASTLCPVTALLDMLVKNEFSSSQQIAPMLLTVY